MTPTAYIETSPSIFPEKEGYYSIIVNKFYYMTYWNGNEWRYYKNVPEKGVIQFDSWLKPVDLSKMLEGAVEAGATIAMGNARVSSDEWDSHYVEFDDHDIAKAKETYISNVLNNQQ